jgi:hypothetical protein
MAQTFAQTPSEMERKGALNGRENPSEPLTENGQILLGSPDEKCREAAALVSAAVREAMRENGFTLGTIGGLIGKDAVAAHRAFDVEEPSTVMQLLAAVLTLDQKRIVLRALSRLVGCEVVEKPRLTDAEKVARLEETLRRHGRMGEAVIEEAYL